MPHTLTERYAVVSCHVERPLDDRVWERFAAFQERRPGGFPIAALLRPPDAGAGEREDVWLERAAEAAARGPLGHHTHWTSPSHARPTAGDPAARVLGEGAWLAERGVAVTLFCGGGWYTDAGVAAACARLGYVDCTPRSSRPPYLDDAAAWACLPRPAWIALGDGLRLFAVPTTHSLGALARAVLRPRGLIEPVVHVYFHDTDLLDRRRGGALSAALVALARRRRATDLGALAREAARAAPEIAWGQAARGSGA